MSAEDVPFTLTAAAHGSCAPSAGSAPERAGAGKVIANFIINDLKGMLSKRKLTIEQCPIAPEVIGFLGRAVAAGSLTKKQMRKLVQTWMDEAQNVQSPPTGGKEA